METRANTTNSTAPITFDVIAMELRNPNSPFLKILNTEMQAFALEHAFFAFVTCILFKLDQQQEKLLRMILNEEKSARAEKPADIISVPIFHDQHIQLKMDDPSPALQPLLEQRESLLEQLDQVAERLNELQKTEEAITEQYMETRKDVIETIVAQVKETPFIRADSTIADEKLIRGALEQPHSLLKIVEMVEKSHKMKEEADKAVSHNAAPVAPQPPTAPKAPPPAQPERSSETYLHLANLLDQIRMGKTLNKTGLWDEKEEKIDPKVEAFSIDAFSKTVAKNRDPLNHMGKVSEDNLEYKNASIAVIDYAKNKVNLIDEKNYLEKELKSIDQNIYEIKESEGYRHSPRSPGF